jgi:hypothetical protein
MIEVVRQSITDGEVCDWVRRHVKKSAAPRDFLPFRYYLSSPSSKAAP